MPTPGATKWPTSSKAMPAGTDRITDFEAGVDDINLSGLPGITSFADLKAHHVRQDGADLIIHAGHDRLIIDDFSRAELQAGDFPFAL